MPGPRDLTVLLVIAAVLGGCGTSPQPTRSVASGLDAVAGPNGSAGPGSPGRIKLPTPSPTNPVGPPSKPTPTTTPHLLTQIPAENYTRFPLLAISPDGLCAIKPDHTLICWGAWGGFVPSGTFKAVGSDEWRACALRTNGKAVCWSSELEEAPEGRFKALSPGGHCAIRDDGTFTCGDWLVAVRGGPFVALSDECAIAAEGSVACWYAKDEPPDGSGPFAQINGPCGIRTDGSLSCWSGSPEVNDTVPEGTFTAVAANQVGGCAIRTSGELACWGDALLGYAPPEGRFTSVTLGVYRSCALREDGIAVCWGGDAAAPGPRLAIRLLAKPPYRDYPDFLVTGRRIPVAWKATPVTAPITSVGLVYDWSRWDGASSLDVETETDEVTPWHTGGATGTATLKGKRGYTYCLRGTATDGDGVQGDDYGGCATIPLDERDLEASAGWTKLAGSAFYEGTALRATKKGRTLTLHGAGSLALGVIATTCPTCGSIEISYDRSTNEVVTNADDQATGSRWRVNLRSSRTLNRALVFLTDYPFVTEPEGDVLGTVTIKVVSKGRPVIIDAVVLAPYED